jgi:hypothetical protein
MKPRSLLIGVGVTCFIVFGIVSIPAKVITSLLPGDFVQIGGAGGTLWNGEAQLVQVSGVQLTGTKWTLHPMQLPLGRLAFTLETHASGGFVRCDITLGITGDVTVRNLDAAGPVAPLASLMRIPQSGGEISLQFDVLTIKNAWPSSLVGSIRIENLPLNLIGVAAGPIGTYEVRFDSDPVPEDGRIVGELQDLGGPLELGGSVFLDPPRNYEFSATIRAGAGAPADLTRGLVLLGPADVNGYHQFMMAGSM